MLRGVSTLAVWPLLTRNTIQEALSLARCLAYPARNCIIYQILHLLPPANDKSIALLSTIALFHFFAVTSNSALFFHLGIDFKKFATDYSTDYHFSLLGS